MDLQLDLQLPQVWWLSLTILRCLQSSNAMVDFTEQPRFHLDTLMNTHD